MPPCDICGKKAPTMYHYATKQLLNVFMYNKTSFFEEYISGKGVPLCSHCHDAIHDYRYKYMNDSKYD